MQIDSYVVVSGDNLRALEDEVRPLLVQGYQPLGAPLVFRDAICQAMVSYVNPYKPDPKVRARLSLEARAG